ncbi:hypothetical protein AB0K15_31375 [Amycolatopsis sp. NPDC049253]|uniref:hypothetical protein n=1 Tax=Amycolatopsis sp. NPDC049253 TaxID=3155274 RepID=UPI0034465D06
MSCLTRWIRYPRSDEDLTCFIEFGDDGWAIRHAEADQVVEISGAEFERVWVPARRALDQAGPSAHAGG